MAKDKSGTIFDRLNDAFSALGMADTSPEKFNGLGAIEEAILEIKSLREQNAKLKRHIQKMREIKGAP